MSLIGGSRRKSKKAGSMRKGKRAGSMLQRAALPGLFTLALLNRGKKSRNTRKGMARKTARKAFMKRSKSTRRRR